MNEALTYSLLLHYPCFESQFLAVTLVILGVVFGGYYIFKKSSSTQEERKLPPGSLGLPLLGESIGFFLANKHAKTREWVETRTARYGPVFKTSLVGKPTVVMTGSAATRFFFTASHSTITSYLPGAAGSIMGKYGTLQITGKDHRLIKGAMTGFMKADSLRRYIGDIDSIIKQKLFQEFDGKDTVKALPFLRRIIFNMTCTVIFALPSGEQQDQLFEDCDTALKGMWGLRLNFPTTNFHRAMAARKRIDDRFSALFEERRKEVEQAKGSCENGVISAFVSLTPKNGEELSDELLLDNIFTLMAGSQYTVTILLCRLLMHLARDKAVYKCVLEEQERVLREKEGTDGKLTWDDIQKMKYTWRVAQELLRITPPLFGNFKIAVTDTSFGGFDIPKGWQIFWVASGTHMDESIFPDPEKVDPSRFEASKSYPPYTYNPFGAGPHICPGGEFGRIEVLLVIHHLITNYEWSEVIPNEPITRQPMPLPAMGLPIKIRRRKRNHEELCS